MAPRPPQVLALPQVQQQPPQPPLLPSQQPGQGQVQVQELPDNLQ